MIVKKFCNDKSQVVCSINFVIPKNSFWLTLKKLYRQQYCNTSRYRFEMNRK